MLSKGVSVYLGEESSQAIQHYLEKAEKIGYSRVFTSLHIPEANFEEVLEKFEHLTEMCQKLKLHLMVDISSYTLKFLGMEKFLSWAETLYISAVRVDFGLSKAEIVELSKSKRSFTLVLNASTLLPTTFENLEELGLSLENLEMSHNFYPRSETGISESFFLKQTEYFQKKGLKVTGFIAGRSGRRGPIFDGLPTLEEHRKLKSSLAFRHLMVLGCDGIYFGDNKISDEELEEVGCLKEEVSLECDIFQTENEWLFDTLHTERPDSSEFVIRSQESRLHLASGETKSIQKIEPIHCFKREIGAICLDNCDYLRYMGELQIAKISLPADSRVNVIGHICEDNLFLLKYIEQKKKILFCETKGLLNAN